MRGMFGLISLLLGVGVMFYLFTKSADTNLREGRKTQDEARQIAGRSADNTPASQSAELQVQTPNNKLESILVKHVTPGGAFEQYYGLRDGDIIVKMGPLEVRDRPEISSDKDAQDFLMDNYQRAQPIEVMRDGKRIALPSTAAAAPAGPSAMDQARQLNRN